jgi:Eukaryotic aspartyl protease
VTVYDKGGFSIQYETQGSGVKGDYIGDEFSIGGITVHNLTMAVATSAEYVPTGIMGIGFDSDESIASNGGAIYPNIVDEMVKQGLINSHSYSLWLNDLRELPIEYLSPRLLKIPEGEAPNKTFQRLSAGLSCLADMIPENSRGDCWHCRFSQIQNRDQSRR